MLTEKQRMKSRAVLEPRELCTAALHGDLSDDEQDVYDLLALRKGAYLLEKQIVVQKSYHSHQPISLVHWSQRVFGNWNMSPPLVNSLVNEDRPKTCNEDTNRKLSASTFLNMSFKEPIDTQNGRRAVWTTIIAVEKTREDWWRPERWTKLRCSQKQKM